MALSICVFCGSNPGSDPAFRDAAERLGAGIGQRGYRLVYGGSHLGLMGAVTSAVLAHGGTVTGVMPKLLVEKEAAHTGLADLRVVDSMHERKALMVDESDAFAVLPGAYGTLDEMFECVTWAQLGIHAKPIVVWNVSGFYDALFAFLDGAVANGLLQPRHRARLLVASTLEEVFERIHSPVPENTGKWLPGTLR